jgi:peptidyl-prolyl cis-trans isomerase D
MFEFVRKHTKIMMFVMFLLIIPAFVLVGVDGFHSGNSAGATVAKVGSTSISQLEWDNAHKDDVDRMRAAMPTLDSSLLDSPQARFATLERLVRDKVLTLAAQDRHLVASDAQVARELGANPTIAALRKPDGSLDMERYTQLLANQGLTPAGFEERVRTDLSARQVESAINASAFASATQAGKALNPFFERREAQIVRFLPKDYLGKVSLSDTDLETFYQANQTLFKEAESADVEYLVLDLESVKKSISLNEQDLKTYYEQNVERFSSREERRASHILITASKDAPAADRQKARERALALLEQLRKRPESFAELARQNSQDPGSAKAGGDLDFFGRGAMVKPFEDAAFALKKGELSDIVESDFGFHIIKLTDVKAPQRKPFEEVRAAMEADIKTQQAQQKYAEAAETFTNGVYEQSDSLKGVAEKLGLALQSAAKVPRQPVAGGQGPLTNPKLLAALFAADTIEKQRNTEAIETAPSTLVSARVTKHHPERTLPFAEVRTAVRERLMASRAQELARADGAAKLQAWKTSPDAAPFQAPVVVSRDQAPVLAPTVTSAVLRADLATLPAFVGVDLGADGYVVVRVNKRMDRTPPEPEVAKQEIAQYAQWLAQAESAAYLEMLKAEFKVQIKVPRPADGTAAQK